jgi:hypothetical protein
VSLYAQTAARTVASPAAIAIQSKVQAKVDPFRPSWVNKTAAKKIYAKS